MTIPSPDELLTFDLIANVLVSEEVFVVSPAELHGLLAGQLASGARMQPTVWLKTVSELLEISDLNHESSKVGMIGLYQQTLGQFESEGLNLVMLLPDDDATLTQRIDALGQWCQGFMTGFGYQGKQTDQSLSPESRETLQDLSQIAQIVGDDEERAGAESDLMELEEYVRMAAIMLFSECNQGGDPVEAEQKQLH
jgi:yecA family protein